MGSTQGLWTDFAEPEMAHLAFSDQLTDGPSDFLHRNVGVLSVLIKNIDHVSAEVTQTVLCHASDVLRARVVPIGVALIVIGEAEFRRDLHLVAERRDRFSQQKLIRAITSVVELGGVEQGDAELVSTADHRDVLGAAGPVP